MKYQINGMTCNACAEKITNVFKAKFNKVHIDLPTKSLEVEGKKADDFTFIEGLIKKAGNKYSLAKVGFSIPTFEAEPEAIGFFTFWPLILVVLMVIGGTLILGFRTGGLTLHGAMLDFMGFFFLFFSFFKLLSIPKFAESYSMYDLIAKKVYGWGYIYPFIELLLATLYLTKSYIFYANLITAVLMVIGTIGVIQILLKKSKIKCACLGGLFNLPMTKITLFEDSVMALMAIYMLFV